MDWKEAASTVGFSHLFSAFEIFLGGQGSGGPAGSHRADPWRRVHERRPSLRRRPLRPLRRRRPRPTFPGTPFHSIVVVMKSITTKETRNKQENQKETSDF